MISSRINEEKIEKIVEDSFTKPLSKKIDEIKKKADEMNQTIFMKREILPLPPFNFTIRMLKEMEDRTNFLIEKKIYNSKDPLVQSHIQLFDAIKFMTNIDSNAYFRLVNIDAKLMNLVEHTENEIFYRPLQIPTMFINNEIIYEDYIIKGITVIDLNFYKKFLVKDVQISFGDTDNYLIFSCSVNKILDVDLNVLTLNYDMTSINKKLNNYIRTLICNTVDMMYAMDDRLNVVTIETTKEHNIKREKRGQTPTPTQIFIRPKDNFKVYVNKFNDDLNKGITKKTGQYMVKGHWRHFRAERYKKETKENPVWIKPFFKGEGIMIAKEYMITK